MLVASRYIPCFRPFASVVVVVGLVGIASAVGHNLVVGSLLAVGSLLVVVRMLVEDTVDVVVVVDRHRNIGWRPL